MFCDRPCSNIRFTLGGGVAIDDVGSKVRENFGFAVFTNVIDHRSSRFDVRFSASFGVTSSNVTIEMLGYRFRSEFNELVRSGIHRPFTSNSGFRFEMAGDAFRGWVVGCATRLRSSLACVVEPLDVVWAFGTTSKNRYHEFNFIGRSHK
jgi:hypothetical protein